MKTRKGGKDASENISNYNYYWKTPTTTYDPRMDYPGRKNKTFGKKPALRQSFKQLNTYTFQSEAFSCANLLEEKRSYSFTEPDPSLCSYGILSVKHEVPPHFTGKVFVSSLIRTWQTAILQYGSYGPLTLIISPYIKSKHGTPLPFQSQIEKMKLFMEVIQGIESCRSISHTYTLVRGDQQYTLRPQFRILSSSAMNVVSTSSPLSESVFIPLVKEIPAPSYEKYYEDGFYYFDQWVRNYPDRNIFVVSHDDFMKQMIRQLVAADLVTPIFNESAWKIILTPHTRGAYNYKMDILPGLPKPSKSALASMDRKKELLCHGVKNVPNHAIVHVGEPRESMDASVRSPSVSSASSARPSVSSVRNEPSESSVRSVSSASSARPSVSSVRNEPSESSDRSVSSVRSVWSVESNPRERSNTMDSSTSHLSRVSLGSDWSERESAFEPDAREPEPAAETREPEPAAETREPEPAAREPEPAAREPAAREPTEEERQSIAAILTEVPSSRESFYSISTSSKDTGTLVTAHRSYYEVSVFFKDDKNKKNLKAFFDSKEPFKTKVVNYIKQNPILFQNPYFAFIFIYRPYLDHIIASLTDTVTQVVASVILTWCFGLRFLSPEAVSVLLTQIRDLIDTDESFYELLLSNFMVNANRYYYYKYAPNGYLFTLLDLVSFQFGSFPLTPENIEPTYRFIIDLVERGARFSKQIYRTDNKIPDRKYMKCPVIEDETETMKVELAPIKNTVDRAKESVRRKMMKLKSKTQDPDFERKKSDLKKEMREVLAMTVENTREEQKTNVYLYIKENVISEDDFEGKDVVLKEGTSILSAYLSKGGSRGTSSKKTLLRRFSVKGARYRGLRYKGKKRTRANRP